MRNFQDIFPGLSRTLNFNFQDFPGPGILKKKIQDFPGGRNPVISKGNGVYKINYSFRLNSRKQIFAIRSLQKFWWMISKSTEICRVSIHWTDDDRTLVKSLAVCQNIQQVSVTFSLSVMSVGLNWSLSHNVEWNWRNKITKNTNSNHQ